MRTVLRRGASVGGVLALLGLAALGAWGAAASDGGLPPRIQTAEGWVQGERTADGITEFRGIPYATPPLGPLRWRAPLPAKPWKEVRPARAFSPDCIQPPPAKPRPGQPDPGIHLSRARGQSEDCLTLNIWSAAPSAAARLPVMVWIYGGGFQSGSGAIGDYDGTHFAHGGVVLVTINYRVGVLGFLVHPELTAEASYHSSGNYGLLDQIAALKWIQQNIAAFGGDPSRVTVFGESAGSTAINILQASPLAKGLFARVIGESTSQMDAAAGLLGRQSREQAEAYGERYARSLGAGSLAALRKLPPEALLKSQQAFWPLDPDGYVLPEEVYATFQAGHQNDVPTLVGFNGAEGVNLRVPWIHPHGAAEQAAFKRLYPQADSPQVDTDVVGWQMQSWATLQALTGHGPSFLYLFEHSPPAAHGPSFGPLHAAEIDYVFQNFDRVRPWTAADRRIGQEMAEYWMQFARTGDPNRADLPHWPKFQPGAPELMRFDDEARAAPAPRQDAFEFVDGYFARRRAEFEDFGAGNPRVLNIDLSRNGAALAASVPDIALDPRDPKHVAVVWRTVTVTGKTPSSASPSSVCHLSMSSDGGAQFSDREIDWSLSDTPQCNAPFVDFAANGEMYIGATLAATTGKPPLGRVVLRKSVDGGRTWSATLDVIGTDTQERFAPNPSVPEAARRTPWDGARGVVDRDTGDVYLSGGYPAPPGGAEHSQRFYSVSTDNGRSFGAIRAYGSKDWPQRWDSHIVAAHGELALAYVAGAVPRPQATCPCIVFATSRDRGVTLTRHFVAAVQQVDTLVHYPPLAADPRTRGAFALALVSEDGRALRVLTTRDDGAHWQEAQVTPPAGIARVSRPAVAYAPDGTLVLVWRGIHPDQSFDVYAVAGADSEHLHTPVRLSSASSRVPKALLSHYAVRGDFLNVVAADRKFVHAAWTDWRTGAEARVYYGRVPLERLTGTGP